LEAWQENLDARRSDVHRLFQATYGARSAAMTGAMARLPDGRAGLWGFHGGQEWIVSHCLFERE
jgi:cyclopropane-fatty-acyl-phospholipid synthase